MVNVTSITDWLELSDCNVTHWLMVLLGCVAAMSEGMGISKKTRHNGLVHLAYNILTSKCCCPDPPPLAEESKVHTDTADPGPDQVDVDTDADDETDAEETLGVELTSKHVTKRATRSTG